MNDNGLRVGINKESHLLEEKFNKKDKEEKNISLSNQDKIKTEIQTDVKIKTNNQIRNQANSTDKEINLAELKKKQEMESYISKNNPKFFEDFEIVKYISCGASGLVYEGRPKASNNSSFALKFFFDKKDKNKKPDKSKKFTQARFKESLLLKRIHHQNIVNSYGHVKINEMSSCLVMGLAKNGDLNSFKCQIRKKILSESFLCYITKHILEGLQYIHSLKIIHMDIKEDNILLDEQLIPKITDFSVSVSYAKVEKGSKVRLPFCGTSVYISPEIIHKDEIMVEDCNKVDIFSLGVMLYHLAFGKFPYELDRYPKCENEKEEKKYWNDNYEKIMHNELTFPKESKKSEMFKDFLRGLLSNKIKERFSINQCLEHPFVQASEVFEEEKERDGILEKFLISLLTDGLLEFNRRTSNFDKQDITK